MFIYRQKLFFGFILLSFFQADWNLNNLPVVPNSILRSIDMDISGMKVKILAN